MKFCFIDVGFFCFVSLFYLLIYFVAEVSTDTLLKNDLALSTMDEMSCESNDEKPCKCCSIIIGFPVQWQ